LQQANKRCVDLQKWKKEAEDDIIPNLKRRVEELQQEVESWQSQAHRYSEDLKQALATAAQAQAAVAAAEAAAAANNKMGMHTTAAAVSQKAGASSSVGSTGWGVSQSSISSPLGGHNGIGLSGLPIGSNIPWGNSRDGSSRRYVPSWGASLPRTSLHSNGGSRWASFEADSGVSSQKSKGKSVGMGPTETANGTLKSSNGTNKSGWSLSEDANSFVPKDFKDTGALMSANLDSNLLNSGSTSTRGESMFGKLALARSKPLVIVDDSNSTKAHSKTKHEHE